jgi:hypothetical protein
MATRQFSAPRALSTGFDRLWTGLAAWSPRATLAQLWRFLAPPGLTPVQRLWRLLWLPFWIWSDIPAPILRTYPRLTSDNSAAGDRLISVLRTLARRHGTMIALAVLFRAITLWAVAGAVWAVIDVAGGPRVDSRRLIMLVILMLFAGAVLAITGRPRPRDIARMLDRSFDLNDRVTTGFEQVTGGATAQRGRGIDRLQIVDATNTAVALAPRQSVKSLLPVREAVLATACILLMAALMLMRGTGAGVPPLRDSSVPTFVTAKDRISQQGNIPGQEQEPAAQAPTVEEVQERADSSAAAQQDLLTLADALDDNPLTKPVADAIRAGDYERAAAELAEIASELDTLSPEARAELADNLDQAADDMSGDNPELQEQVQETADSLRTGEETTEAATDLSEEVRKTGEKVVPQEELASDMHEARTSDPSDGERSVDRQPESGADGEASSGQPSEPAPEEGQDATGGQGSDSGSSQSSDGSGKQNDTGSQEGGESESSDTSLGDQPGAEGGDTMSGGESTSSDSSGEGGSSQSGDGQADGGQTLPEQGSSTGSNDNAQQGSGSGAGSGEEVDGRRQTSNQSESRPGTGGGNSPDPNVNESETATSTTDQTEIDPSTSITLSRSPDESGYQAGSSSGSSSSGSGQGAAAGTGSVEQGDVGVAGPDANRVPDEYRSTVEEYFSGAP